ncbi:von Willebrand factor type A domain protein [Posidoniimonas polymericola]|uniref:von Willebrand factor type A domain protein n=1 Tax=Posidoniimonas polymericola TaxID=2528002 RepID=A0A5C5YQE7_9BACT|nr:VWA domain-containing protein [Posidoniimonas polymericola]TWT77151.1 von Willebrand factor type A domain protein [Posidoniimonas polymericola]
MSDLNLPFDNPWWPYLLGLLAVLVVALVAIGRRSLSGLGRWRWLTALVLRSLVVGLIILAIADMQHREESDKLTVLYLLDQSLSIPEDERDAMRRFVNASVSEHRRDDKEDRAGVIVFGRDAEVELPPVDFDYGITRIESTPDRNYSNLEGALQKAMSLFPPDAAKRIVVVTDGNENIGNALRQARAMAGAGISIDVLPVPLEARSEVSVDKVVLPPDVRRDQPFEMRVVLDNQPPPDDPNRVAKGKLRLVRKTGEREETLVEKPVELKPGKNVFGIQEKIEQADFYTYEARFEPDAGGGDASTQNNTATAFTHVRGRGHVLVIEDWEHPGEFAFMVDRLRGEGLEVTLQPSDQLFTSLAELQRYDSVVLANVPRSSGFTANAQGGVDTDTIAGFSDAQLEMLVSNTEDLGCGLIMLGGDRSLGAGDWEGTEVEKALPVDFRIKAAKVEPIGALAMIMHASEFAKGNYWQKVIAREAIRTLGPKDYCGLIQWNQDDQWLWNHPNGMLEVGPNRAKMMSRVDRLVVGDMPQFDPGMVKVAGALAKLTNPPPAIKHCIIISDGDPSPPKASTIAAFKKQNIQITTVAVGALGGHGDLKMMQNIALQTGGKFYVVKNANALPKIYKREARRIARPVTKEFESPTPPIVTNSLHEILQGVDGLPPITGYVKSTLKDNTLVEQIAIAPDADAKHATLLAVWTYGLGKSAVVSTDAGARWANDWTAWENYGRFYSQLVRWSMRPTGDTGNYSVATEVRDGQTRIVVDALDKDDQFINTGSMTATVLAPDMTAKTVVIEQVAPGRYVGEFDTADSGSYMLAVNPGPGQPMIRTGVNVGYSDEFRDRETNRPLLTQIANLEPRGGQPGKLIDEEAGVELPATGDIPDSLVAVDPYRRDMPRAVSSQDRWPLLVMLASCLFFADVFVRRVQFDLSWTQPAVEWVKVHVFMQAEQVATAPTMSRLQSKKREIRQAAESRAAGSRAAETRFDYDEQAPQAEVPLADVKTPPKTDPKRAQSGGGMTEEPKEEESYLSRLKKAKEDAKRKK